MMKSQGIGEGRKLRPSSGRGPSFNLGLQLDGPAARR